MEEMCGEEAPMLLLYSAELPCAGSLLRAEQLLLPIARLPCKLPSPESQGDPIFMDSETRYDDRLYGLDYVPILLRAECIRLFLSCVRLAVNGYEPIV